MIELRRRAGAPVLRIGHRGAAALAPENTLRSLRAAVEAGVDFVELDAFDLADGTLVLAHSNDLFEVSHGAATGAVRARTLDELLELAPDLPTLDEALAFFAEQSSVGVHVDVKCEGREDALAGTIRRHGLVERTLVSSFSARSLVALAAAEPRLTRGFTYPNDRYGIARRRPLLPLAHGAATVLRAALPRRVARALDAARASAAMLHYSVLSPTVVERCHAHGAAVFAWTINDRERAEWAARIGVDGVISDDPRLLAGLH